MPFSVPEKLYICPGQSRPISRGVHLSRLAACFPACRECPFRDDTGQLPPPALERRPPVARGSLLTVEGYRGVHRNELTRAKADALAGALASLLWDEAPPAGRIDDARRAGRRPGPVVVVGFDERPSSPDIVAGVTDALRRMGCAVVEIGLTTKPCFWFTVDHLHAAAGMFVTGAGCDPAWTGLDLAWRGAIPMSLRSPAPPETVTAAESSDDAARADLRRIEARLHAGFGRPTRQAGPLRTFQAMIPYEAGLLKHFHALRPLRVCVATPVRLIRRTLERLFETLPCDLVPVPLPCRARHTADPADRDVRRLGEAVRQARADVGLLIDDDGQRCALVDERGLLIPPRRVAPLLAEVTLGEHPGGTILGDSPELCAMLEPIATTAGGDCQTGDATLADISLAMRRHRAIFAATDAGRYWFREAAPTCDGLLTLARTLAALSRSDVPLSAFARRDAG